MMSDTVFRLVKTLKDGSGRHIFQDEKIDNSRVAVNNSMATTVASGSRTILFGNFDAAQIVDVGDFRIFASGEVQAELDRIVYFALLRSDITVLDAHAFAVLTH